MQIIHALWEERNIGSNTYEINIQKNDNFDNCIEEIEGCNGDYIVVRIPAGMADFISKIPMYNYRFVETALSCHYSTSMPFNISEKNKKLLKRCRYEKMLQQDLDVLHKNLNDGLYNTDRIALDPFYSVKISNNRYRGWINDEIGRGAKIFKVICDNNAVAFFGLKKLSNADAFGFLNGVYTKYQGLGFGTIMHCLQIQASKDLGFENTLSSFSSNNYGAFSIHMSLGYKLDQVNYVYIKHRRQHA